ncbi:MAG: hypothetical protein PHN49_00030 [Candidatus Omnitrophica bacterium]|nr:hypothetical protein [Candidatus Omnitrophota bacterium]
MSSKGYRKRSLTYYFDQYWLSYGFYVAGRCWIRKTKPAAVILANDHSGACRAMLEAARDEGIMSVYIQHAAIRKQRFPPLGFDYAFLCGRDDLEKYESFGPSRTKVFLAGLPRMDVAYGRENTSRQLKRLGIATTYNFDSKIVEDLLCIIRQRFVHLPISLRFHPAFSGERAFKNVLRKYNISISHPHQEPLIQFLDSADVLICGVSSIHLEAVIQNVYPLYYAMSKNEEEFYGYVEKNLVESIDGPERVCEKLEALMMDKPGVRQRAQKFHHLLGTKHEGRSAEIICSLLATIAGHRSEFEHSWKKISGTALEAYELT